MKKTLISTSILLALTVGAAGMANAATEAEKRTAIDNGLVFLASSQVASGAIGTGGLDYLIAQTGSALLAFLEEKPNWGANAAAYQTVVDNGLNYLLSNAVSVVPIAAQTAGNPDADGNGVGVKFYPGAANSRDTYVTGIVLPAFAKSGTPNALVSVGPLAGRIDGSGAGGAWTYKDVVQNTVDYFAFGQNEGPTTAQGGWRYFANSAAQQGSDQSTTQWPIIGTLFANEMGVTAPNFMKTELAKWTTYIQNPATGAAGYTGPYSAYGEMNETGALLIMQSFLGKDASDANVQKALGYINTHWQETANSYDGNFGQPYAMWAIYKGLESTIGLDYAGPLFNNLHADPGDVDNPNHDWNWWEDYCESLVNSQLAGGGWSGYSSWGAYLATAWNINILAATEIPDNKIPEPGTLLLFGTGMIGLARVARRRKG